MPDIQSPDPGRKVAEKYNIVGPPPVLFLSPELVPVVLIDDLTEALPGIAWAIAPVDQPGGAGVASQTALRNPSDSGILIENLSLRVNTSAGSNIEIHTAGPSLASTSPKDWQDQRRSGAPVGIVTQGTDVGAVTGRVFEGVASFLAVLAFTFNGWVMPPGGKLHLIATVVNVTMQVTWQWTETPE